MLIRELPGEVPKSSAFQRQRQAGGGRAFRHHRSAAGALCGGAPGATMKLSRRAFLRLAAGAAALHALPRFAWAQAYPTRPIRIIVPFPAGGPTDVMARLLADRLPTALGQPVIVENRSGGAGGSIGAKAVSTADPDGYTLLLCPVEVLTQVPLVYRNIDYDPIRSFAPIALLMTSPNVFVVNPAVPVRTLQELAAYAKANPGRIKFASPGYGTSPHLMGELFKSITGAAMIHVPYRGSAPAVSDLLAGQVQMYLDTITVLLPHIEAGTLRALAVASEARSPYLPDVPTTVTSGFPSLQSRYILGLYAPPGTSAGIIGKINAASNDALKSASIQAGLKKLGAEAAGGTVADFAAFMSAYARTSADMVATAGIQPE
jgi:tripartite-type tricarboxylate transporter receptor subunit TctC